MCVNTYIHMYISYVLISPCILTFDLNIAIFYKETNIKMGQKFLIFPLSIKKDDDVNIRMYVHVCLYIRTCMYVCM
jgi:hypothetical protein